MGNSEYLPYNLWLLNFMSMQGYTIKNNVLYQDNQSTILMLKMGETLVQETQDTFTSDTSL